MASFTSSSIPQNPTLRSSALNTVIVIPLLSSPSDLNSNSEKAFKTLFRSLVDLDLERGEPQNSTCKPDAKEITLIIPNANLTPPGEWRYDDTPLQSHDWSVGCQRIMFADGIRSIHANDRLKAFDMNNSESTSKEKKKISHFGEFVDLYPSRGTSAIIGVLSVKDCADNNRLLEAEEELRQWAQRFTPLLYAQKYWDEAFDSPMAPKHFITKRLFVFDSFDYDKIDLTQSTMTSSELIAFPPTENMDLHLNVVVNDLAVAIFMNLEKRIRILDGLSDEKLDYGDEGGDGDKNRNKNGKVGIGDVATIVGNPLNKTITQESDEEGKDEDSIFDGTNADSNAHIHGHNNKGKISWKNLAANAVKVLNKNHNMLVDDAYDSLPPIEHELQTIIDVSFDEAKLTTKDIESIFKRNSARREKYSADLALLAGSAMDAYDRYTRSAESLKQAYDPLWYAAAVEGIATSFVAMSDTGGHGADLYLENNFQYPNEVMAAALSIQGLSEDGKESSTRVDKSKTTMPAAVYALLEESASILSHNVKLASIYSELLLKMAWYTAELEGLHLRCRWGEGFSGCSDNSITDGRAVTATISGVQKRWEMASVSKIDLEELRKRGKLDATLCKNTLEQCQRLSGILHRSVSNGGLDAFTRANVGAICAKICLEGVRVPCWSGDNSTGRVRLPRKAAFFTTVAAESMSQCMVSDAQICAAGFWAAASHLYTKEGNKFEGNSMYAWATLRATILHAMSLYGGSVAAETGLEKLLLLLGECASKFDCKALNKAPNAENLKERIVNEVFSPVNPDRKKTPDFAPDSPDKMIKLESSRKPESNRSKNVTSSTKNSFPAQSSSSALVQQSQWINDEAVPLIILPLIEPSTLVAISKGINDEIKMLKKINKSYRVLSPLLYLSVVPGQMKYDTCVLAQRRCIAALSELRRSLPTSSLSGVFRETENQSSLLPTKNAQGSAAPLEVVTAKIIKSESHLLLDKLKAAGYSGKVGGSLSTFFNPFANKKKESMGKNLITLIAQGEERTIVVEFSNCLSVPLEVSHCQLAFDKPTKTDIEAPPLSFTLPSKTEKYAVHFPFTIVSFDGETTAHDVDDMVVDENESKQLFSFGVVGIRVSTFNRSFFIPFHFDDDSEKEVGLNVRNKPSNRQIPDAISVYQTYGRKKKEKGSFAVNLEAVPAQPNLLVSFATSPTPLEDAATIPVHLSDGEIFTIPAFRLENDFGPSGRGSLERLQILGVGMPGLPEEILFDTDELAKALEAEEDRFSEEEDTEGEDFEELMESDGLPPLKMKCLAEDLSLASINDKTKSLGQGSILSFQVAATHDMGNKLSNGGNVRIKFRYRGPCPIPGIEIWRKREIALKIVRVKGPRISSLTFRSDLSWGSAYSDMCWSLSLQQKRRNKVPTDLSLSTADEVERSSISEMAPPLNESIYNIQEDERSILNRVAQGNGVFISRDDIVILMAVANETNSTIVLSNRAGVVGGFESSPMPTVKVSSGVSVKIPVVIPRIHCFDGNGEIIDIANELIVHTALKWESEPSDGAEFLQKGTRQGRVRIPSKCLREMIQEHPSFATRICRPPFCIELKLDESQNDSDIISALPGYPLGLSMTCSIQDWVPLDTLRSCSITLEFCCARKNSGINAKNFEVENKDSYIWCGQARKSYQIKDDGINYHHRARLCFVGPGDFVISGCAKIARESMKKEEVWWSPEYRAVKVQFPSTVLYYA